MTPVDFIGLVGAASYIAAHHAVQVQGHPATSRRVMWLNVIGPACILVSMTDAFNLASFITQCFWLGLTVVGAMRRGQATRSLAEPATRPGHDEHAD